MRAARNGDREFAALFLDGAIVVEIDERAAAPDALGSLSRQKAHNNDEADNNGQQK